MQGYIHVLFLQHLHVHLLDGQRDAYPVVHQLAQTDLRMMLMKRKCLFQQELGFHSTGERITHLHLNLLAGSSRTFDISLAFLHPHDLANELCSLLLQEHLRVNKKEEGNLSFGNIKQRLQKCHLCVEIIYLREKCHALLHKRSNDLHQQ